MGQKQPNPRPEEVGAIKPPPPPPPPLMRGIKEGEQPFKITASKNYVKLTMRLKHIYEYIKIYMEQIADPNDIVYLEQLGKEIKIKIRE